MQLISNSRICIVHYTKGIYVPITWTSRHCSTHWSVAHCRVACGFRIRARIIIWQTVFHNGLVRTFRSVASRSSVFALVWHALCLTLTRLLALSLSRSLCCAAWLQGKAKLDALCGAFIICTLNENDLNVNYNFHLNSIKVSFVCTDGRSVVRSLCRSVGP